jgi:hypothetical protein
MTIKRLDTTTVVLPFEHDVEEFINALITISNAEHNYLVYCDVGKVVGIYKSALELYSVLLNVLMTEPISESNLEEVETALNNFCRVDSESK